MKIKHAFVTAAVSCGTFFSAAYAADFEDMARVINVTPQIEQFNHPQRECRTNYVQEQQRQSRGYGGSVIGGIVGGLLGNQIGRGNGRTAATAAAAITGAIVGDRLENNQPAIVERPVQECHRVDHWESRNNGYAVTYEYQGRRYTTVMPYDPGDRLRLHVSLSPRI